MKPRGANIALLFCLGTMAASCFRSEPLMEPFSKLEGRWVSHGDEGTIVEKWHIGSESLLLAGEAWQLNGTDSTLMENLQITATDSGIYYIATVIGQNNELPVGFKLMPSESNMIVFTNPGHDFPKQLTYTFKGNDSLIVNVKGDSSSFTLHFTRN